MSIRKKFVNRSQTFAINRIFFEQMRTNANVLRTFCESVFRVNLLLSRYIRVFRYLTPVFRSIRILGGAWGASRPRRDENQDAWGRRPSWSLGPTIRPAAFPTSSLFPLISSLCLPLRPTLIANLPFFANCVFVYDSATKR